MRVWVVGLLLVSSQALAGDREQIDALYAGWRTAVETSDIDGYINSLHSDVRLLPPGAPAIVSAEAYRDFLKPVFATATYKIVVDTPPQIEIVGDMAIAEYDYTIELTLIDPDVGVSEPGALTDTRTSSRYFDVLRKNDAGEWRVWRHSWQVYPSGE